MNRHRIIALGVSTLLLVALTPFAALAAGPIDAPEGFAELRARFQDMTPTEVRAAGYIAEPPVCVSEPDLGSMGVHAVNGQLVGAQFPAGEMDPQNPPVVLLSADMSHVVGLEWEAKDVGQGETELFGQKVVLQPGHPGIPEPHYMLHAYFRPNGKVLFAPFDPQLSCELPDSATVGSAGSSEGAPLLVLALLAMAGAAGASMALRQRSRREPSSPA
jgi:hypothetical protein